MRHCKFCSRVDPDGARTYPHPGCPGCGPDPHIAEAVRVSWRAAHLESIGPGTPLARLRAIAEFAAAHCGHSPVSSTPPEIAVLSRIAELTAHLATVVGALSQALVVLSDCPINYYDYGPNRSWDYAKSQKELLIQKCKVALSSPPIAALVERQAAERRVIATALEISNAYPAIRRVPASIDNWDGEEIPAYLSPAAAMVNAVLIAKLRIALGLVDLEQP